MNIPIRCLIRQALIAQNRLFSVIRKFMISIKMTRGWQCHVFLPNCAVMGSWTSGEGAKAKFNFFYVSKRFLLTFVVFSILIVLTHKPILGYELIFCLGRGTLTFMSELLNVWFEYKKDYLKFSPKSRKKYFYFYFIIDQLIGLQRSRNTTSLGRFNQLLQCHRCLTSK